MKTLFDVFCATWITMWNFISANSDAISAITSITQTLFIIIAFIPAIIELSQINKTHRFEVARSVFNELSSPEARKNRSYIYSRKSIYSQLPNSACQLTSDDYLIIDETLSSFDRIYIFIDQRQINKNFIFDTYGELFLKVWGVLTPFIEYERNRRGIYYRQRANKLVDSVKKYFKSKNRPVDYPV